MIRIDPTTPALNTSEYFSTLETFKATKLLVLSGSDCCYGCSIDLPAMANLSDPTDIYTNDLADFIIKVNTGDVVTGTLIAIDSAGVETSYTITDNTYGRYWATGSLKTNVWGFLLNWYNVANLLGFGRYKFNITVVSAFATEIYNEDSSCFQLMPFSCDNAHRTVRITTEQKGYFEGGFDYTGLSYQFPENGEFNLAKKTWRQSIRLWGRFYRSGRELFSDNIVTKDRGQEQVQTQTVKVYTLKLDTIQTINSNKLIDDMLQAPEVYIDDYNRNNIETYERVRVVLSDLGAPINNTLSREEFYSIEFKEYFQNNVHRYK